jgi:acyl carrier protein
MSDDGPRVTNVASDVVWDRLKALLIEVGGSVAGDINSAAVIGEISGLDSVAFVEIIVTLEEEFGVALDPVAILERGSFGAIVEYVREMIHASSRS